MPDGAPDDGDVCQVRGWRETPIFARSSWWTSQQHPVKLPAPVCEVLDIIEHFTGTQVISAAC